MSAKQSSRKPFAKKQATPAGSPFNLLNKPAVLGLLSFIILALLLSVLIYQRYLILKESQKKDVYDVANAATDKLQQSLAYSLSATKILSFFVDNNGQVNNFDSVASQILVSGNEVDALQLVPGGVIRYVYPLQGNEAVLGYDILKDPSRNKEAYKAIEKKELYFAGPFNLRQGGIGVVGRLPLFRNGKFWGFSAVVIKMPTLLKAAGIDTTGTGGYYFQLSKINPDTQEEEFFIRHNKDIAVGQSVSVNVPNGEWKLSVAKETSLNDLADILLFIFFGLLFSLLGALFIYHVARRPRKLDELVRLRTRQLKQSEEKFSKAFHSNLLGLAIYDTAWRIVDVNETYASLLEAPREQLLGKPSEEAGLLSKTDSEKRELISTELDQLLVVDGYVANYEAHIKTRDGEQHSILLSIEELEFGNEQYWLTSAIDITGNKKAELLMQESEEKYRTLVEQASDGIVITDLDGYIIEVNKSICLLSGYPENEMLGQHLYKFVPADDVDTNPLRINELMQGKALLYERRLLRKDGSTLDIEVNSKMASSHTLIGFIRDITERKKNERESQYQARLLESVSDAITSLDMNRCIVSWNKACEDLYGLTSGEVIGKRIPELVTFDFPGTSTEEVFKKVYSEGHWRGEFNFIHPHTQVKTYLHSGLSLLKTKEGDPSGFIITSRDITEQKKAQLLIEESEEKYRTLVEQANDGIFIADKQGRFLVVNSSGYKMSQYSPEEMSALNIYDLVVPEDLAANPFQFSEMMNAGGARAERRMKRKDGTLLDVEVSAKFISGERFLAFVRDISERKKAEEKVRISNERFAIIAQATNDAVWDHDFRNNETWGNKKLYSLYGFDSLDEKIDFEMFLDRIHPDEQQGIVERLNQAIERSENSIAEEFHFKTAGGEYRTFYDRAYIKYDEQGKPQRILGAMQDVTDREKTEKQILKEKELSDSIINSLPGVFYLYTREGKFLRWNKNFETITGYTGEEISGMHPLDFFDEPEKQLLQEKIANVFVTGQDQVEAGFLTKKGEKIMHYFTGQAIQYEGQGCLMGVGFDISEKEKAAKKIQESEEKFRTIIEQASDGIFIAGEDTVFLDVNGAGCRMLGYTREELTKMRFMSLVPPEDLANNPVKVSQLESGNTVINEHRLMRKDGSIIDVEISAKKLQDGRYQSFVRDITERKQAEKALLESQGNYKALVEHAPEALVVFDVDQQKFVSVSTSASRLFKMTEEELLKTGPVSVSPPYQADGRSSQEAAAEYIRQALEGDKPVFEWTHCDKEGNTIPCEVWLVRLPAENKMLIRGSIIDITERKKADNKFRTLLESAADAMVIVNEDGQVQLSNTQTEKVFGYTKQELIGQHVSILMPARYKDIHTGHHLKEFFKNPKTRPMGEGLVLYGMRKNGEEFPIEISLSPLEATEGLLVSASIRDITERKRNEEEILKSKMQFQSLVENISGVYWVNNLDSFETLYISPSYETIWGRKADELYKNPAGFIDAVHPDDKQLLAEAFKNLPVTRQSSLSYRIIRPDGETRWIHANTNVITDVRGNNIEYGYAEDITDRKNAEEKLQLSEQKYRLLFYNNPLPMWMVTIPDLMIIDVNDAAIKQYGYSREEFLRLSTRDLRPPEDIDNFLKEVDTMKPGIINVRAWRHKKKDGTIIQVETYSHQIMYEGRMVWLGLSHDVTEEYKAKELLQKSYEDIRMLASNLQSIREDERTNIAREIHDELGQQLTGLKMDMHWLSRKISSTDEEVTRKMKDGIELVNSTIATVRKIATDLRPSILDDLGLLAALEWQSEEFERRSGTHVVFTNKAGEISVKPATATALFRIYQEVLTNVARHANASQVEATLDSDDKSLYISIKDNGVGFDVDAIKGKKTLGLLGIKERSLLIGGTYEIKSKPGHGSEILISLPLEPVKTSD
ncbi:MAG TPA: PAS domain S-box protein [Ferruginibacter sp.]|nr:PAS domain S-box protein [Ferruginibacter sp.]